MKLYSLPIFALLLFSLIETNEPTLSVDFNDRVIPGDSVLFEIMVENTTVNKCNDCIVYVDTNGMDVETLAHIDDVGGPLHLPDDFQSEGLFNGTIEVLLGSDCPDGEYRIPIVFEGTLGDCDGGCYPFRIQHEYVITVTRNLPALAFECERVCDFIGGLNAEIPMSIVNTGAGVANDVKLSLYGVVGGYVYPDSFEIIGPSDSYPTTVYVNTANLSPGFYDLGVNIVYYDEYFKLYSEKVKFRIQVRPQRPQIELEVLNDGRSILIDISNEGGLKAKEIEMGVEINGNEVLSENIDEIGSAGSVLIPLEVPEDLYGDLDLSLDIYYKSADGQTFETNREMFLNIPKNNSESNRTYYYLLAGVAMIFVSFVLVKKIWVKSN